LSETAAIILAGGGARRMGGGDKPMLNLAGTRMIERIVAALDMRHIAISDPTRFASLNLPVLADGDFTGEGPLAGALAGMEWAVSLGADTLLTVPGDTPFIPSGLVGALVPAPACAASNGRVHHLVALRPVARRGELRRLLTVPGRRDVGEFAAGSACGGLIFPRRNGTRS
jgi:molybdopterin-guanine dinucleotide biosynthesis protein A